MRNSFSRRALAFFLLTTTCAASTAQHRVDPAVERDVEAALKQLTLEEKISLCSGDNGQFRGVDRLHIPRLFLTDGPRGPNNQGPATAFPVGVMLGSTWNPTLIQRAGQVMGEETRAVGEGILLGPGINIQRDPLGGRSFEYFTEDPYLNSRLAVAVVKGIQSEGVAACLKHFVCNNREDNRNFYMSMVDARTLNEIYLPAFKASVEEGDAWSVMTSANGVNGGFVSDSRELLQETLKDKWKFEGMVFTDWLQTRSTEKAAFAGLDISMPGGDCLFAQPLLAAVKASKVPVSLIDDKVRRILRVYGFVGLLEHRDLRAGAKRNMPDHQAVARQVAAEGIVLLKNDKKILPIDPAKVKSILVLGPSADRRFLGGGLGGSSGINAPFEVTTLAGLKETYGDKVQYLATDNLGGFQPIPANVLQPYGFIAKYFAKDGTTPQVEKTEPQLNFMWEMRGPDPKVAPDGFRAEFTGTITPPISGDYAFRLTAGGAAKIYSNGILLASASRDAGRPTATALLHLQLGKPVTLRIEYTREPGDAALSLAWETPLSPQWKTIDDAVKRAETVVVVGGIDHSLDTEGWDRPDMHFPADQQNLINRVAKLNSRVVVVLINGSPLELGGWLGHVPAVLEAWYPGMEGGHAVADVLSGKVDPSGKLPFSWPKLLADSPSHKLATENNDVVNYQDKLMVGYRYFDTAKVEPQFPFGFGLSYTSFNIGGIQSKYSNGYLAIKMQVKNVGFREGSQTVQVYVHPLHPSVTRPIHELKAFQKIALKPGESGEVSSSLGPEAFSFYNAETQKWEVDPGEYEIQVGFSSRQMVRTIKVKVAKKA